MASPCAVPPSRPTTLPTSGYPLSPHFSQYTISSKGRLGGWVAGSLALPMGSAIISRRFSGTPSVALCFFFSGTAAPEIYTVA